MLPLVHVFALLDDPEHGLVDLVLGGAALVPVDVLKLKNKMSVLMDHSIFSLWIKKNPHQ